MEGFQTDKMCPTQSEERGQNLYDIKFVVVTSHVGLVQHSIKSMRVQWKRQETVANQLEYQNMVENANMI